jgi:hypothetical protein
MFDAEFKTISVRLFYGKLHIYILYISGTSTLCGGAPSLWNKKGKELRNRGVQRGTNEYTHELLTPEEQKY